MVLDRGLAEQPSEARGAPTLRELFRRLADGDLEALAPVYDRCAPALYGLALWRARSPQEAEDLVQEAFVRLVEKPRSLARVRRPKAYLLRIVHRLAIDAARRRSRETPAADEALEGALLEAAPGTGPHATLEARELSRHLATLGETQRTVVFLRSFLGLSFAEVGRVMGTSTFTAASRHRLALRRLRQRMGAR